LALAGNYAALRDRIREAALAKSEAAIEAAEGSSESAMANAIAKMNLDGHGAGLHTVQKDGKNYLSIDLGEDASGDEKALTGYLEANSDKHKWSIRGDDLRAEYSSPEEMAEAWNDLQDLYNNAILYANTEGLSIKGSEFFSRVEGA
jgi:hypothetical protein